MCFSESGTISIMNRGMSVTQDQQVEFHCLMGGWYPQPTVGWSLNGIAVNSSLYNTSSVEDGDSFNSTSILNFKAVSSATVECWAMVEALTRPRSSTAFMVVGKKIKSIFFKRLRISDLHKQSKHTYHISPNSNPSSNPNLPQS